jgi:nucleoside-diphosphate-sugar epimerase
VFRDDYCVRTALVTGSSGQVGRRLLDRFKQEGWETHGFDLKTGDDLRDEAAVLAAVDGCEVVVHAGAIAHDSAGTPVEIVSTNVLGTWHVLLAAERCKVSRVVYLSSAQVFGFAEGEGTPDYLPVDDAHPRRASRPYGMSKRLAEDMCAAWTSRTSIPTLVLRPVMILDDDGLEVMTESEAELGAFVHVDDVVDAAMRAVAVKVSGHHLMTLCGPGAFDTSVARHVLGWTPRHSWPLST